MFFFFSGANEHGVLRVNAVLVLGDYACLACRGAHVMTDVAGGDYVVSFSRGNFVGKACALLCLFGRAAPWVSFAFFLSFFLPRY